MLEKVTLSKINKPIWVPSSRLVSIWMIITNGMIATGVWLSWLL